MSTYVIDLAPDPAAGQRRQTSKGGFPTKKAAEEVTHDALVWGDGGTGGRREAGR